MNRDNNELHVEPEAKAALLLSHVISVCGSSSSFSLVLSDIFRACSIHLALLWDIIYGKWHTPSCCLSFIKGPRGSECVDVVWENYKLLTPQTLNLTGGLAGRERERERDRKREWEIKKRGGKEMESLTEGSRDRIMKSLNELKLQCQ